MRKTDQLWKNDLPLTSFGAKRNQQSMDELYDQYSSSLYGLIYRIMDNEPLAEECLMTTFVKAWNDAGICNSSDSSLFTWLLHLARQSAFEAMAKQPHKNSATKISVNGPGKSYSAFELVYFKGLSLQQAAEVSGISVVELKINIRKDLQNRSPKKEKV